MLPFAMRQSWRVRAYIIPGESGCGGEWCREGESNPHSA
jgi:hypothetical protein